MIHVHNTPPMHPLSGKPVLHYHQYPAQVVRVIPDADMKYIQDERWKDADKDEKSFALALIGKLCGNEYPVIGTDVTDGQMFYNLLLRPKLTNFDIFGVPQTVGYAFVPGDYVTVVRSGFPEAS
jgi:hypothetical protein